MRKMILIALASAVAGYASAETKTTTVTYDSSVKFDKVSASFDGSITVYNPKVLVDGEYLPILGPSNQEVFQRAAQRAQNEIDRNYEAQLAKWRANGSHDGMPVPPPPLPPPPPPAAPGSEDLAQAQASFACSLFGKTVVRSTVDSKYWLDKVAVLKVSNGINISIVLEGVENRAFFLSSLTCR